MKITINTLIKYLINISVLFSLSMSLIILGNIVVYNDFINLLLWIDLNVWNFLINVLMIMIILIYLFLVTNSLFLSFLIIGLIYIILCSISHFIFYFKGSYLIFSDFQLISEAINVIEMVNPEITIYMVLSVLFIFMLAILCLNINIFKIKFNKAYVLLFSSIVIVLCYNLVFNKKILSNFNILTLDVDGGNYSIDYNYLNNGFLYMFLKSISENKLIKPDNYSKHYIDEILKDVTPQSDLETPNIIIIQSEALYDIEAIESLKLNKQVQPNLKRYQDEFVQGKVITTVFGGSTVQTEYEVLSSNSIYLTGREQLAYLNYVNKNFSGITSYLKDLGYYNLVIHPFYKDFYSREHVFKLMGFDKFISEKYFEAPEYINKFISDREVFNKLISEYEASNKNTPFFSFIVTMQNHGTYYSYFDKNGIIVENHVTDESRQLLTNYSNLLNESDASLKHLIDYFSKVERPTIIMIYGDHAPILGSDLLVYRELEHINSNSNLSMEDNLKLHITPLLIWNNYGLPSIDLGYIDTVYLVPHLLTYANMNADVYYNFLINAYNILPGFNFSFIVDKDEILKMPQELTEVESNLLNNMKMLVYDRIVGRNYSSG